MAMSNDRMQIQGPGPVVPEQVSGVDISESQVTFGANNINVKAVNFLANQVLNLTSSTLDFAVDMGNAYIEYKKMMKKLKGEQMVGAARAKESAEQIKTMGNWEDSMRPPSGVFSSGLENPFFEEEDEDEDY